MSEKSKLSKKELEEQVLNLTADLQRTRADFENYRKRVDSEKTAARQFGRESAILELLPVIDDIDRAASFVPDELRENAWAKGVSGLSKQLEKALSKMNLQKIDANPGVEFNPELHEAVQFDESDGEKEIIADELRSGYTLDGRVVRHAMVKVTKQ